MFGQPSTPFGSPPASGGFGQPAAGGFGSAPAPGFGAPAPAPFGGGGFGTPAPAPGGFGTTSAFGTPAPAPGGFGGFGASAPAPPAFGGGSTAFGQSAPAPSTGIFGAPSPAPGGLFGSSAPAPAPGLFGSAPAPSGFGAPAPSTGFGGFGAPTPAPPAAFGSTTNTFGAPAPAPSGLFGAPAPAPTTGFGGGGFGAPSSTTTSAFGAPAPAPGLFGSAPAPAAGGGLFGSPAAGAAPGAGGTKIAPYTVTNRQDGTSSINLQAITAMPQYEQKSFEELRFEDYSQGNRGSGSATAPVAGGFGAAAGGFGSPAPAPGLFGASSPAPAPFGAGGFGAPAPAPGAFGAAPTPAPFGAFGSPAPATTGGMFGSTPAPAPGLFGSAPAPPAGGGLFGAPAPATGGLFGSNPAPAPAFGAAPAPGSSLFGATAPAPSTGLFGAPAPAPSAFGAAPASGAFGSFGATPAPAPSLFGQPPAAPAPFGASAFGAAPASGSSLFGAAPAAGGLFGAKPPAAPGMFGAPAAAVPPTSPFGAQPAMQAYAPAPVGAVIPPAANDVLKATLTSLEESRKKMEKSDNFRSRPKESAGVNALTVSENESLGLLTPARVSYPAYRASPKSTARPRPRGFSSPDKISTPSLSRLGTGGKPMPPPDSLAASSATRLVINPSPKPKLKLTFEAASSNGTDNRSPLKLTNSGGSPATNLKTPPLQGDQKTSTITPSVTTRDSPEKRGDEKPKARTPNGTAGGFDYYQQVIAAPDAAAGTGTSRPSSRGSPANRPSNAPTLSKSEYNCSPSIDALQSMAPEDLATVSRFSVMRPGFGRIEWEGSVDVRGADLDAQVIIEKSSVSVYENEEKSGDKPTEGTKLNRPAVVTLQNIFPPTGVDPTKFARKVEKQTAKMDAKFIDYDRSSGVWTFRVEHFSRYGLLDDDDSDSEIENASDPNTPTNSRALFKGRRDTPFKPRGNVMFADDVDEEDEGETALVSDVEMSESRILEDAETAYKSLQMEIDNGNQHTGGHDSGADETPFPDEGNVSVAAKKYRFIPSADDMLQASSTRGICANIAKKSGCEKSSTDFGLRMGRSFRVAWSPDGTVLHTKPGGGFVKRKPVFSMDNATDTSMLKKHEENSLKVGENAHPQFTLPSGMTNEHQLQDTLISYAEKSRPDSMSSGSSQISRDAFSLLKCLSYGKDGDSCTEPSRLNSIKGWLVDSCCEEVANEVDVANSQGSKLAGLLAAVSGGNTVKACEIASEIGLVHLPVLLSAGPEAQKDLLKEVMAWTDKGVPSKIPDDLIRIYFMICGDLHMEEDIYRRSLSPFDWRRRMLMKLAYKALDEDQSLSGLISSYKRDLEKGVAPYPHPPYLKHKSRDEIQCVLYRLLCIGKNEHDLPLLEIINPLGHTRAVHDFSLSFHLAAAITAMYGTELLTTVEEQSLNDGYVAQLLNEGKWEWAVYVSLCVLNDATSTRLAGWKNCVAKSIILQNYCGEAGEEDNRRQFLESSGIPPRWFEEALAYRAATKGDTLGYLAHIINVSPELANAALEQTLIPNILFMNKEKTSEALTLLQSFAVDESSLAFAMSSFFQVHTSISQLRNQRKDEIEKALPNLLSACKNIEEVFSSYLTSEETLQGPTLRMVQGTTTVPMACFLAEGLSQISLFKLQLRALQEGISLSNTASQILNLSLAKDISVGGLSSREDVCRWLM